MPTQFSFRRTISAALIISLVVFLLIVCYNNCFKKDRAAAAIPIGEAQVATDNLVYVVVVLFLSFI